MDTAVFHVKASDERKEDSLITQLIRTSRGRIITRAYSWTARSRCRGRGALPIAVSHVQSFCVAGTREFSIHGGPVISLPAACASSSGKFSGEQHAI